MSLPLEILGDQFARRLSHPHLLADKWMKDSLGGKVAAAEGYLEEYLWEILDYNETGLRLFWRLGHHSKVFPEQEIKFDNKQGNRVDARVIEVLDRDETLFTLWKSPHVQLILLFTVDMGDDLGQASRRFEDIGVVVAGDDDARPADPEEGF